MTGLCPLFFIWSKINFCFVKSFNLYEIGILNKKSAKLESLVKNWNIAETSNLGWKFEILVKQKIPLERIYKSSSKFRNFRKNFGRKINICKNRNCWSKFKISVKSEIFVKTRKFVFCQKKNRATLAFCQYYWINRPVYNFSTTFFLFLCLRPLILTRVLKKTGFRIRFSYPFSFSRYEYGYAVLKKIFGKTDTKRKTQKKFLGIRIRKRIRYIRVFQNPDPDPSSISDSEEDSSTGFRVFSANTFPDKRSFSYFLFRSSSSFSSFSNSSFCSAEISSFSSPSSSSSSEDSEDFFCLVN